MLQNIQNNPKTLNNVSRTIKLISKVYFRNEWFEDMIFLMDLFNLNEELVNTYQLEFKNKIKAQKYLIYLFEAEHLIDTIIDNFTFLICMKVFKGQYNDREYDIISSTLKEIQKIYVSYSNTMLNEIKKYKIENGSEEFKINDLLE